MRADGKRLKNIDPMYTVASYIMNKRTDAMNMITVDVPIEPIQRFLNEKRKDGIKMSHMSVVMAAYLRTVQEFPLLNNFIVNTRTRVFNSNNNFFIKI